MRRFALLAITFTICSRFELFACFNSERRFAEEVADFAEYLKQKQEKQPVPNNRFDPTVEDSVGEYDLDYLDDKDKNGKKQGDPDFETFLEDLVRSNPNDNENLPNSEKISSSREILSPSIVHNRKSTSDVSTKQHHGIKEIVYIRESESELNDPIPEMIEKLVNDQPAEYPTRDAHEHFPTVQTQVEISAADAFQSDKRCPVKNFTSFLSRTCSYGAEYEMEFDATTFEALKHQMADMLPEPNPNVSKCDFTKRLGPKTGIEDRALCPFVINITNRNPSRIPEYLYEANCSCQVWRPRDKKQFKCVQVKISIPVLWLMSCDGGKKRYKQGWDEIAVACAPVIDRKPHSIDEHPPE